MPDLFHVQFDHTTQAKWILHLPDPVQIFVNPFIFLRFFFFILPFGALVSQLVKESNNNTGLL